jgi:hypothetical protein
VRVDLKHDKCNVDLVNDFFFAEMNKCHVDPKHNKCKLCT